MRVTVEPYVPCDQSLPWRAHHAYSQHRGPAAWTRYAVSDYAERNIGDVIRSERIAGLV